MADELANELKELEYHPVLVFGPQSSGKTTLILSLIDYLMRGSDGEVEVRPGKFVIPDDYPSADQRTIESDLFFRNKLQEFQKNIAPIRTSSELPFLVPIELRHRNGGALANGHPEAVRLAFVEGMGEWYEINSRAPIKKPPAFKDDIAEILRSYERGISIIYAAPAISGDPTYGSSTYQQQAVEMDSALFSVIDEYVAVRPDKSRDHELFLLSKWDTKYSDSTITSRFAGTMEQDVYAHIHSPLDGYYKSSWNKFSSRPRRDSGSLFVMPHFAGRIPYRNPPELRRRAHLVPPLPTERPMAVAGSSVTTLPVPSDASRPSDDPRYTFVNTPQLTNARDHFNRTLANWLYGNATEGLYRRRVDLFPDVGLSEHRLVRWYEYFIYCLVGGGTKKHPT